jgi:hypothetical protein
MVLYGMHICTIPMVEGWLIQNLAPLCAQGNASSIIYLVCSLAAFGHRLENLASSLPTLS